MSRPLSPNQEREHLAFEDALDRGDPDAWETLGLYDPDDETIFDEEAP